MKARMLETLKAMDTKQVALLALGPGVLTIAGDVAIAHFAGREMVNPAQLLPVTVAPLAAVALMAAVHPRLKAAAGRIVRGAGLLLCALGVVGTGFHLRALLRLLAGDRLTWQGLQTALAVAPPLFAPGAFIGLGALVWLLGRPEFQIWFQRPAVAMKQVPAVAAAAPRAAANDTPAQAA